MDNNPAISLFHGSDFGNIDMNSQQPEELEAIEDEKRRNEELQEMIFNAFDDLEHEDTQTVDNSYLTSTINDPVYRDNINDESYKNEACVENDHSMNKRRWSSEMSSISPGTFFSGDGANLHKQSECINCNQFKVLYQVRLREIERLHEEISVWSRKLKLTEAGAETAVASKIETENILGETKLRIRNLEEEMSILKHNLEESEKLRKTAVHEKQVAEITIRDLKERLIAVEKNINTNSEEKQFDNILKSVHNEYKQEISSLQKQIDNFNDKLCSKEKDYMKLEERFLDLQRVHESLLIEKYDTINKLTNTLEEVQSKYQKLVTSNLNQDSEKLHNELDTLRNENCQLELKLQSLTGKYETLQVELQQYENLSKLGELLTKEVISPEMESFLKPEFEDNAISNRSKGIMKLKEELRRAIINQKTKRSEIAQLQEKLITSDKIIKDIKTQESSHIAQINSLKDSIEKLKKELEQARNSVLHLEEHNSNKLSAMKNYEMEYNNLKERTFALEEDNAKLRRELSENEKNVEMEKKKVIDHYSKEYLKFHQEKILQIRRDISNDYNSKVLELESKLEESIKECNEIKELYTDACILKDKVITQNENNQKRINELANEKILLNDQIKCLTIEKEELLKSVQKFGKIDDKKDLLDKVSHLQSTLNASQNEFQVLEQKLRNQFNAELNSLRSEKRMLQNKITIMKKEIEKWKEKCALINNQEINCINNKMDEHRLSISTLENKLKECEVKLKAEEEKHKSAVEMMKLNVAEYVTRINVEHSEKISQLQIQHAQKICKLKIKHQQLLEKMESSIKILTMEAFDEEVANLTSSHKEIFKQLIDSIECYENNLNDKTKHIEILQQRLREKDENLDKLKDTNSLQDQLQILEVAYRGINQKFEKTNEASNKLLSELKKLQTKYENSRKVAIYYKQLAEKHNKVLKSEKQRHTQILRNIQKQMDKAIESKQEEMINTVLADVNNKLLISSSVQ